MRKRVRAERDPVDRDAMWMTEPPAKEREEIPSGPSEHRDQPTYEDVWYRVLGGGSDGPAEGLAEGSPEEPTEP